MTEKRFTVDRFDLLDNGEPVTVEDACKLLNELHETIQYWSNKIHKEVDKNIELQNENDKLKQKIKSKNRVIQAYEQYINDLKEDGVI